MLCMFVCLLISEKLTIKCDLHKTFLFYYNYLQLMRSTG